MKLSDLIAKGRRTVLKILSPKNPRKFTGAVIRRTWRSRAARGHRIDESLATTDVDLTLPLVSAGLATCAALRCCLPLPWDPGPRRPSE